MTLLAFIPDVDDSALAWQAAGACRGVDPDLFFPERGVSTAEAKAVCAGCPVQAECLDWALARGERFGIWGGKSERERRRMRRERPLPDHGTAARYRQGCDCDRCFEAFRTYKREHRHAQPDC